MTDQQADLVEVFNSLGNVLAFDPRDWGENRRDAWLYAVLSGWDCEEQHEHDNVCENGEAMREMAAKHGWSDPEVARVRRYREAVRRATEARTIGDNPPTSTNAPDNPEES